MRFFGYISAVYVPNGLMLGDQTTAMMDLCYVKVVLKIWEIYGPEIRANITDKITKIRYFKAKNDFWQFLGRLCADWIDTWWLDHKWGQFRYTIVSLKMLGVFEPNSDPEIPAGN